MNLREDVFLFINVQGDNGKSCMDCYEGIDYHMLKYWKGESLNKFCICFEIRTSLHCLNIFGGQMTWVDWKSKEEHCMA